MTNEDFVELQRVAAALPPFRRIGVFSSLPHYEGKVFPSATRLSQRKWDLNYPGREQFDLLVASSVFMYSPNPARWFRHVLASCRYFVFIDLIRRRRAAETEFGPDHDLVRYAVGSEKPQIENQFDLANLGDRLLGYRTYFGGANAFDPNPRHVIALFRGDLAEPTLRLDDYPTGIRILPEDMAEFNSVVRKCDDSGVPVVLGVVPALLNSEMIGFLRSLKNVELAVHGYDHGYPKSSPVLRRKGDPFNERSIGVFDEFSWKTYGTIHSKLGKAKDIVEQAVERPATTYIPPCNIASRRTGRALEALGFARYFSEKRIPGSRLPWTKSSFYGRSAEFDPASDPDVVTLHVTWEWDVLRKGDREALPTFLKHMADHSTRRRQVTGQVAAVLRC